MSRLVNGLALAASTLALLAGCRASAGSPSRSAGSTVRSGELPPEHVQLLADYGAGGERWAARRVALEEDPTLVPFLVDNLVLEMVRCFDASAFARAGELKGPFERAQSELVRFDEHSVPVLVEMLDVADGPVAFVCAQTLERVGEPAIEPVLELLSAEERETRRRGAALLAQLPPARTAESEGLVQSRLGQSVEDDPEWVVRVESVRSLSARAERAGELDLALASLSRALSDEDPAVLRAAAEELGRLGDARAVPALLNGLERSIREDRLGGATRCRQSLAGLLGEEYGLDARAWRQAWKRLRRSGKLVPLPAGASAEKR